MTDKETYILKCVILGDFGTGKSSIITRYCNDSYNEFNPTTIGVDFFFKQIVQDSITLRIQLWDTAGQEKYKAMLIQYIKNAYLFIIVFDITDYNSFLNITNWIKYITENIKDIYKIVLIGNKIDNIKKRKVSYEEAQLFSKVHNINYYEVSAKNNLNINESFNDIFFDILTNIDNISANVNIIKKIDSDENINLPIRKKNNNCICN